MPFISDMWLAKIMINSKLKLKTKLINVIEPKLISKVDVLCGTGYTPYWLKSHDPLNRCLVSHHLSCLYASSCTKGAHLIMHSVIVNMP